MRVFSTLVSRSNENNSCVRVDESWQARVCMRLFSTLVSQSNEKKSCMRVFSTLTIQSKEANESRMKDDEVENRTFACMNLIYKLSPGLNFEKTLTRQLSCNSCSSFTGTRELRQLSCKPSLANYHQLSCNCCSRLTGTRELRKLSCKPSLTNSHQHSCNCCLL